jgi:hypothetical protein
MTVAAETKTGHCVGCPQPLLIEPANSSACSVDSISVIFYFYDGEN